MQATSVLTNKDLFVKTSRMSSKAKQSSLLQNGTVICANRKASHDYVLGERFTAGICLNGSEVASLRRAQAALSGAFVVIRDDQAWLNEAHIAAYAPSPNGGHVPLRQRRLLLTRRQIDAIATAVGRAGATAVPMSLAFDDKGRVKVEVALATGKNQADKRQASADRSWQRDRQRLVRGK